MNILPKPVSRMIFHIIFVFSAFAMLSGISAKRSVRFIDGFLTFKPLRTVVINNESALPAISTTPDIFPQNGNELFNDTAFDGTASALYPIEKVTVTSSSYNATPEEFRMLCCVVQREVANLGEYHKKIIVNVILNRVDSNRFPDTISEVLHQKNQFPTIVNYYDTTFEPDETTIKAVTEVLSGKCPDLSKGALCFYNPKYTSEKSALWFEENLQYLYTIDCHRFFRYEQ